MPDVLAVDGVTENNEVRLDRYVMPWDAWHLLPRSLDRYTLRAIAKYRREGWPEQSSHRFS